MKAILDKYWLPAPGEILRIAEAKIRDGHFHYYEYESGSDRPIVALSDEWPEEVDKWLSENELFIVLETSAEYAPGLECNEFATFLFPEYVSGSMDPDYEAWWDGVVVELKNVIL